MPNATTKVLCHRGCHHRASENTLEAFEQALCIQGVDGIETDVRLSAEGVPVLFHDRLAHGQPVCELTHRQLQTLVGYDVPTLEEALYQWDHIFWNVEIKAKAALEPTLKILKRHSRKDHILMTSFMHDVVAQCAQEASFDCGLLICHRPHEVEALLHGWEPYPHVNTISWYFPLTDPSIVDAVAEQGYRNYLWGMQTQSDHVDAVGFHADGLITDYPELLV